MTPRVALLFHNLAAYRRPAYEALLQEAPDRPSYQMFAADFPNDTVRVLSRADVVGSVLERRWAVVRNLWFGRLWLWQVGAISRVAFGSHDVVILLGAPYYLSTWVVALIAKMRGTRVLMWTHGLKTREAGIKARLRLSFYALSDGLLLYGHRAKRLLQDAGYDGIFYIVGNCLDYDLQRACRLSLAASDAAAVKAGLDLPPNADVVTTITRIVESKRLDQLLHATARLRAAGEPVYVVVIGDGPERHALETLAGDLGLAGHVRFVGECTHEETIGRYFSVSAVSVLPGNTGLPCIHALAYGCPMITHDGLDTHGPEVEAILPGETGDWFRESDVEHLAEVMMAWINKSRVPSVRARVRTACIAAIESAYTPTIQRDAIDDAVRDVLGHG